MYDFQVKLSVSSHFFPNLFLKKVENLPVLTSYTQAIVRFLGSNKVNAEAAKSESS